MRKTLGSMTAILDTACLAHTHLCKEIALDKGRQLHMRRLVGIFKLDVALE